MSINDFYLAGMKILAKQSWALENDSSSSSCLLTRYMLPVNFKCNFCLVLTFRLVYLIEDMSLLLNLLSFKYTVDKYLLGMLLATNVDTGYQLAKHSVVFFCIKVKTRSISRRRTEDSNSEKS